MSKNLKFNISVSNAVLKDRPTDDEVKHLRFRKTTTTIDGLISIITSLHPFTCGTYKNNRRHGSNFETQQICAVDIDEPLSIEEINSILEDYGIMYNFAYETMRSTESSPRHRLIFLFNGVIKSKKIIEKVNKILIKIFAGNADGHCSDAARFWYPSNKKIIHGKLYQQINFIDFLDKLNFKQFLDDHKQIRSCLHSKNIDTEVIENSGNERSSIIYTIRDSSDSTENIHYGTTDGTIDERPKIENWNLEDLMQFEIFRRFFNGEGSGKPEKLEHMELFGIASNLFPLVGGQKLYKECLDKNKKYASEKYEIMSYMHSYGYNPMHINKFSRYDCDAINQYQTFAQAVKKKGKVSIYEKWDYKPVEAVFPDFKKSFEAAVNADNTFIYLFLVAAGMGKSALARELKNTVIAFPNHKLKLEHFNISQLNEETEKVFTPDIKNRFSEDVEKYFGRLYASDLRELASRKVKDLAKGKLILDSIKPKKTDIEAAKKYLEEISYSKNQSNASVFTTHIYALQSPFEGYETILMDEDPMAAIIERHTVTVKDLRTIYVEMLAYTGADEFRELINEEEVKEPKATPKFPHFCMEKIIQCCAKHKLKSHVIKFFESDFYRIENGEIHYTVNNVLKFSPNKKYIICDATASIEIYKKLFGDRLIVVDYRNVKNKGNIIQHTGRSYSKDWFRRQKDYDFIHSIDTTLPTITHKDFKYLIPNATPDNHFGCVRGTNIYEGKNINVVGTMNYDLDYYRFLSAALKLNVVDFTMANQTVSYDGREFKYKTFTDVTLQRIHLETVEAELIQAVQRARLIRHDVTVYVYSSFALAQAEYRY